MWYFELRDIKEYAVFSSDVLGKRGKKNTKKLKL